MRPRAENANYFRFINPSRKVCSMIARLRSIGVGGSIATLLATGALLVPAAASPAPAQAYGSCQMLESLIYLANANGDFWYVWELWERGIYMECW